MANANTIKSFVAGSIQNTIASLALGTSTTETAFSLNGNSIASIASKPLVISLPTGFAGSGQPFKVRGFGTCTTGASTNLTLKLYQVPSAIISAGTAATLSNDAGLLASTARAVNSTTAPFYFESILQWDAVSQALKGQATFEINSLLDVFAATTAATGLTSDKELNFLVSATLSTGNAANVVNLQEIDIDLV